MRCTEPAFETNLSRPITHTRKPGYADLVGYFGGFDEFPANADLIEVNYWSRGADMKNFEADGSWFLPDNPDRGVAGRITYSSERGLQLSLHGYLGSTTDEEYGAVHGLLYTGEKITLMNCLRTSLSFGEATRSSWVAEIAMVGDHVADQESARFDELHVTYSGLDFWLGRSGLVVDPHPTDCMLLVKYDRVPPIELFSDGSTKIVADFQESCEYKRTRATVEQQARILISSATDGSFRSLDNIATRLQEFLALACGQAVEVLEVEGIVGSTSVRVYYEPVRRASKPFSERAVCLRWSPQVSCQIGQWLSRYDLSLPAYALYFGFLYNPGTYAEEKFLSMARALEAYHRCTRNNNDIEPTAHEKRLSEIMDSAPAAHSKWLKDRLQFSNEPTLRKRLTDLASDTANVLFTDMKKVKKATSSIVSARNGITHPDGLRKQSGESLVYHTEWMKLFLEQLMFAELGMTPDQVKATLGQGDTRNRLDWLTEFDPDVGKH